MTKFELEVVNKAQKERIKYLENLLYDTKTRYLVVYTPNSATLQTEITIPQIKELLDSGRAIEINLIRKIKYD